MRLSVLLVFFLFIISCKRDAFNNENSLIGQWKLASYYLSPGGETT